MAERITNGRGVFITLEGPDGAGKSSQARLLAGALTERGVDVVLTREPGGTPLGERIRELLLGTHGGARDPLTDALLFNAARRQLLADVIRPALAAGSVVVCDRYADSTLAYQGHGAGVELALLRRLAEISTGGLVPDRTILLDLPTDAALARRAGGPAAELTRFETADAHDRAFHERVRAGFLALAAEEPGRWRIIDAARPPEVVAGAVLDAVSDLLGARAATAAG